MCSFHDKHARTPSLNKAKAHLEHIISILKPDLQAQNLCTRIEYTGSSFQDLRVNDNYGQLEFDVVLILDKDIFDCRPDYHEEKPGYFLMMSDDRAHPAYTLQDRDKQSTGLISGKSMNDRVFQVLTELIRLNSGLRRSVKLYNHSPAVKMEVRNEDQTVWFCVDLVPTYEDQECNEDLQCVKKRWVPKAYSSTTESNGIHTHTWYQSFAVEETSMFAKMGDENDPRKKVERVLKMIVFYQTELRSLSSYKLKTVLLNHMKDNPKAKWTDDTMGERLTELLNRLAVALNKHYLDHYFIDGDNLLKAIPFEHQDRMAAILYDMLHNLYVTPGQLNPKTLSPNWSLLRASPTGTPGPV